ncbi:MAG: insulinase family protein [Treponema sp.]|nr:insulinase family protein [Treponema sp.]
MKKSFLLFLWIFPLFSLSAQRNSFSRNYAEYTLANGLEVFVLEDFSKAMISMELSVRAGINCQSKENAGFFTLYSRLFNYDSQGQLRIKELSSECNADSSRYSCLFTPIFFEKYTKELYAAAFQPEFSDQDIKRELKKLQEEALAYQENPAFFINSAIDSRVFSKCPWKNESSLNPKAFSKISPEEARKVLTSISKNWYNPKNTSIFISGPVKKEEALSTVKTFFSAAKNVESRQTAEKNEAGGQKRKFVLVSPDFSTDLTQIVLQYTSLPMTEADLAAVTLNFDDSSAKKLLLRQRNLAIREAAYINFEAAHKSGTSRIIIQSLLEKPVNPKVNLMEQAELFVSKVQEGFTLMENFEVEKAKKQLEKDFLRITSNSDSFMNYLSEYRAIEDFIEESNKEKTLRERLLERPKVLEEKSPDSIKEKLLAEKPFVFVLLNTKTYQAQKKIFDQAGYTCVTQENAPWYKNNPLEEELQDKGGENEGDFRENSEDDEKSDFSQESRSSIKRISLQNGIPVTVKTTDTTGNILIMVSLSLGKFSFPEDPGFEEVITRAFASNIQKEILKYEIDNVLESSPEILSESFNDWSAITVECSKEDAGLCLRCISDAIIFGEITPSEADSYVFSVQTQKRLYNANPVNQMTYRGIRWLYDQKIIRSVFSTDEDLLTQTTYQQIKEAYPSLLDSRLYNIVVVGNIDYDYLLEPLKKTFGLFAPQKSPLKESELQEIEWPADKAVSVKIRHLFYTDVKAEDAGPMPAILVPTKNFYDPVQFWIKSPQDSFGKDESYFSEEEVLFDALMLRFKERLEDAGKESSSLSDSEEKSADKKTPEAQNAGQSTAQNTAKNTAENSTGEEEEAFSSIKLFKRSQKIPASALSFVSVGRTKKVEEIFSKVQKDFLFSLSSENPEREEEVEKIKNLWVVKELSGTAENRGSAILIRMGGKNPRKYLDQYDFLMEASAEDFYKVQQKYFSQKPPLRLYSSESSR